MASGYLLGIDVGTTRTAAATCRIGAWPSECEIVNLGDRSSAVPSVLYVGDDGSFLVGEAAERRATSDPDHIVREFKRRIGDPTPVLVSGRPWAPEELAAQLVQWVVERVTQREGGPATHLAVTHPASWGAHKKDLLGAALRRHGLPVVFLAEPQAAALHYAAAERVEPGSTIAVYDFGGGTFDAAVVHKDAQGFSLLGRPEGVERLGGIDLDELVFEHVVEGLPEAFDALDEDDPAVLSAVAAVRRECTEAKEALSADTAVSIPVLTPVGQGSVRLHRSEFEAMIHPHVEETVSALHRAIASAGVTADQLTAVLLVGGSSRIPLVAQMVSEQLGRPVAVDADPKNAIAKGAALSLTPAGISATGAYAPAPRGHSSGPVAMHGPAPVVTGSGPSWPAPPGPTGAYAAAAATEAFVAPTQRMSSSRPTGPTAPPARPPLPDYEPEDAGYSYAPAQQRRSPAALVGAGGAAAAVAVLAMVFLWPRPAVSTASLDTAPTVAATTTVAVPTTEAAPTTTVEIAPPKPPVRVTPRVVPPPVTTTVPPPTTTEPPPTTTKAPPTTTEPPTTTAGPTSSTAAPAAARVAPFRVDSP
ncbi:MAG TPA: Hsp70 family protein [Pseudonocardia sp.]|nr:Hsp70 family protein [Pseudonocardia sp.]